MVMINLAPKGKVSASCDVGAWLKSAGGKYKVKGFGQNGKLVSNTRFSGAKYALQTPELEAEEIVIYEFLPE